MSARQRDFDDDRASSSSAAGRGVDYEREDPEMDRTMRRLRWVAAFSLLAGFCSMYLAFCHKPPTEPDAASRPVTPAAVAQSTANQSDPATGGQSTTAGGQSTTDLPMSNGYRVGPDGRLLQPDQGNLTPPQLPEEAKQESAEGARAFAEYYVELHIYTWKAGDTPPLQSKITPDCSNCANTVKQVDGLYSTGGWIDPKGVAEIYVREVISRENVHSGEAPHSVIVDFTLPGHMAYQNGSLSSVAPISQTAAIDCCWVDNQWKACGLNARTN